MIFSLLLFNKSLDLDWWSRFLDLFLSLWLWFWCIFILVVNSTRRSTNLLFNHLSELGDFVDETLWLSWSIILLSLLRDLKVHMLVFVFLAMMGSSWSWVRLSRIDSILSHGLVVKATLRPPPIRSIFCTILPPITYDWALSLGLYSNILASSHLVNDSWGIDHPDLLISLRQISLSLLLPIALELFLHLLFVFFVFILADVIFNQLIYSFLVLGCEGLGAQGLSLGLFKGFGVEIILLPAGSCDTCFGVSNSCQLLRVGPRLTCWMILSLLHWL